MSVPCPTASTPATDLEEVLLPKRTTVFTARTFTIAPVGNNSNTPTGEWVHTLWDSYIMEYYTATRGN